MDKATKEKKYFLDKPENVLLVVRLLYVVCAAVFLVDIVDFLVQQFGGGDLRHAERSWEGFPGFYPLFGFIACTALVLIAKELRKILMRGEDYYDR